jgi:hypothetical protein
MTKSKEEKELSCRQLNRSEKAKKGKRNSGKREKASKR